MLALEWTLDKWLMQGLLTSILTGVGFLVISFTIEYVKRFRKGRQAREQEIFLQRILCGEQVLEWSNGVIRARGKKECLLGTGRSMPRGHVLFDQYKRTGGFLGVGVGYYSRVGEARRRLAENFQDRSTTAAVSRASWGGGPGSRAILGASSTSVDDELTSLEWDTAMTFAPPLPSYVSPTSCSLRSDQNSKGQSGSNGNNVAAKTSNSSLHAKQNSGIRLWSTQYQKSLSRESDRETAAELSADLCARALREHPHLAPYLRRDVLEAAKAMERDGAKILRRAGKKSTKPTKRSQESPSKRMREKSWEHVNKEADLKDIDAARVGMVRSIEKAPDEGKAETETKMNCEDKKHTYERAGKGLPKRPKKMKSFSLKEEQHGEFQSAKETANIAKKVLTKRSKSSITKQEAQSENAANSRREMSSTSVKSLPTRQKSETNQRCGRESSKRSGLRPGGSKSQTVEINSRPRRRKSVRDTPRSKSGKDSPSRERAGSNDGVDTFTWPCAKTRSATSEARELRYGCVVKRQGSAPSETREKSISSSVNLKYTSFEEKVGVSNGCRESSTDACTEQTQCESHFEEEENKDVISSSISGYIRKLVFGDSHVQLDRPEIFGQARASDTGNSVDPMRHKENVNRLMLNSPMTTIEEVPYGSCSKSANDTCFNDLDNFRFSQESMADLALSEQFEDEEMNTDTEINSVVNLTENMPPDHSSYVEDVSITLAAKPKGSPVSRRERLKSGATNSKELTSEPAAAAMPKVNTCSRLPGKAKARRPTSSVSGTAEKRKTKRHATSSPPLLLTSIRSRASVASKSPEMKESPSCRFKRSSSNQSSFKDNSLSSRSASKNNLQNGKTTNTKYTVTQNMKKAAGKNDGKHSTPYSFQNGLSSLQQDCSKSEKVNRLETKQEATVDLVTNTTRGSNIGSPSYLEGKRSPFKKTQEIKGEAHTNVAVKENKWNKPQKSVVGKDSFFGKKSRSKPRQPIKMLFDNQIKKTNEKILKSEVAEKPSGLQNNSDRENIIQKSPAKEKVPNSPKVGINAPYYKPFSGKEREVVWSSKQVTKRQQSRSTASKMFDNYKIEIKKKELLGAVVSLVTYHPKNATEATRKNVGDSRIASADQSENCTFEMNNARVKSHNNLKDASCQRTAPLFDEYKSTSENTENGCVTLPTSGQEKINLSTQNPVATPAQSPTKESKQQKHPFTHLMPCPLAEFDTDSESEPTCTSKYGLYSPHLHDPKTPTKQIGKFKTIIDTPENTSSSSSTPFVLRPSVLDGVVKHLGTHDQLTTVKEIKPCLESSGDQKPPASPRSVQGFKSPTTPHSISMATKPIDSLALDMEMATTNSLRQARSLQPQLASKWQSTDKKEQHKDAAKNGRVLSKKDVDYDVLTNPLQKLGESGASKNISSSEETEVLNALTKDGRGETHPSIELANTAYPPSFFNVDTETRSSQTPKNPKFSPNASCLQKNESPSRERNNTSTHISNTAGNTSLFVGKPQGQSFHLKTYRNTMDAVNNDGRATTSGLAVEKLNTHKSCPCPYEHPDHDKSSTTPTDSEAGKYDEELNLETNMEEQPLDSNIESSVLSEEETKSADKTKEVVGKKENYEINLKLVRALSSKNEKKVDSLLSNEKRKSSSRRFDQKDLSHLKLKATSHGRCPKQDRSTFNRKHLQVEGILSTYSNQKQVTSMPVSHQKNVVYTAKEGVTKDKSSEQHKKDLARQEENDGIESNLSPEVIPKNVRKHPVKHQKLLINRTSPVKLQELDRRNKQSGLKAAVDKQKINSHQPEPDGSRLQSCDEKAVEGNTSILPAEANSSYIHKPRQEASTGATEGPSILHKPEDRNEPESMNRETEAVPPPAAFPRSELDKSNLVTFQKLNVSKKKSLVFRPPSEGKINCGDVKFGQYNYKRPDSSTQSVTVVAGAREADAPHIFGSNVSFAMDSFQAACPVPSTKSVEPEVKVSNYRFAEDRFQTYRQRKQSDDDE